MRILITTDNHLGFKEKDPVRGEDSFRAFEEILGFTEQHPVDLVLLLGDLFHEANTTLFTLNRCMEILHRKVGRTKAFDSPLDLGQAKALKLDPHSIPTILIHGNHDLPIDEYKTGSLDILEKAGYVKYLGKFNNYDQLEIEPFILQKNNLRIGVYSLGFIKDTKLNYLLRSGKIRFIDDQALDFRLLMIHQNRYKGGRLGCPAKNCMDLATLPSGFFDLILWGHEHQSYSELIRMEEFGVFIYQPGSSIPTSLSRAEAVSKHVGILSFSKSEYKLEPIRLTFQRPIILDELLFRDVIIGKREDAKPEETIRDYLINRHGLKQMQSPIHLPLIRVKIGIGEMEELNSLELEIMFEHLAANRGWAYERRFYR